MAVRIIESACHSSGNRATVVIEGDNPEEVMTKEARETVLTYAARMGISRPGIQGGGGPYPVNQDGEAGDPVETANSPGGCKYRYDWPVQGGL